MKRLGSLLRTFKSSSVAVDFFLQDPHLFPQLLVLSGYLGVAFHAQLSQPFFLQLTNLLELLDFLPEFKVIPGIRTDSPLKILHPALITGSFQFFPIHTSLFLVDLTLLIGILQLHLRDILCSAPTPLLTLIQPLLDLDIKTTTDFFQLPLEHLVLLPNKLIFLQQRFRMVPVRLVKFDMIGGEVNRFSLLFVVHLLVLIIIIIKY